MSRFKVWLSVTGLVLLALAFAQETTYPELDRCEPGEVVTIENESLRFLVYQELRQYLPQDNSRRPRFDEERYTKFTFSDLDTGNAFTTLDIGGLHYYLSSEPEAWTDQQLTCEELELLQYMRHVGLSAYAPGGQIVRTLRIGTLEGFQHMINLRLIGSYGSLNQGMSSAEIPHEGAIRDLSPLTNHPSLEQIVFPKSSFENYGVLGTIPNLKILDLSKNAVDNLTFLEGATRLESLDLHGGSVEIINDVPELPALQTLDLRDNGLQAISVDAFKLLPRLQFLDLRENALQSLEDGVFENLTGLQTLYLEENELETISNLVMPLNLEELDLSNNYLAHISIAEPSDSLTSLNLENNKLEALSFLEGSKGLTNVYLHNNAIQGIDDLPDLPLLRELDLSGNLIRDITELISHPSLNENVQLNLTGNCLNLGANGDDIEAISQLRTQIRSLQVGNQRDDCVTYANLVPPILDQSEPCINDRRQLWNPKSDGADEMARLRNRDSYQNYIETRSSDDFIESANAEDEVTFEQQFLELITINCGEVTQDDLNFISWRYTLRESYGSEIFYSRNFSWTARSDDTTLANLRDFTQVQQLGSATQEAIPFTGIDSIQVTYGHSISTLVDLAYLEKLEYLYLPFGKIDSFQGLQNLPNLRVIDLRGNLIRSFQLLLDNPNIGEGVIINISSNCFDPHPDSKAMRDAQQLKNRGAIVLGTEFYGDHCQNPNVTEPILEQIKTEVVDENFLAAQGDGECLAGHYARIPDPNLRIVLDIHPHMSFLDGWIACNVLLYVQPRIISVGGRQLSLTNLEGLQYFKSIELLNLTAHRKQNSRSPDTTYHYYNDVSPLLDLPNLREISSWGLHYMTLYHDVELLCGMKAVIPTLEEQGVTIHPDPPLEESIEEYCSSTSP
ncbi:MAG: leucine-rich repeat domain-containing protein [Deinococcota bacterium]